MRRQTAKPKIAVWNNGEEIENPGVEYFFGGSRNLFCMPRWHVAALLGTEYVCIIDDDMLPASDDLLENCAKRCKHYGDERIIGHLGKELGPGPKYYKDGKYVKASEADLNNKEDRFADVVLGQFMFLHVSLLKKVPLYCPYYEQRGDDIWISLMTSRAKSYHVIPYFTNKSLTLLPTLKVGLSSGHEHYFKRDKMISDLIVNGEIEWIKKNVKNRINSRVLFFRRMARRIKAAILGKSLD
jgi:hypothetical protein